MSVKVGDLEFDRASYDPGADVLYLHVGDPETAFEFDASSEGHPLRYDIRDRLVGITILNARWHLEREGAVVITAAEGRFEVGAGELSAVLASPAA